MRANTCGLKVLLRLTEFIDNSTEKEDGSDEDFEDAEFADIEIDGAEEAGQVIDLDVFRS